MIDSLPPDDEDHHLDETVVDGKFHVLKIACGRVGQPKLVQTALSVIDKLVSCDLLVGDGEAAAPSGTSPPPSESETVSEPHLGQTKKLVIDSVIGAIFQAVKNHDDEETCLLALRCVLTCVLSKNRQVNGSALMGCIRTCYLINKDSKSAAAQSTARTALSQILNALTSRLDASDRDEKDLPVLSDWAASYGRNLINKTVMITFPDNEEDDTRGIMGWCVVCNEPGNYFCRKSREAVCSMVCKRKNLMRLALAERASHAIAPPQTKADLVTVFKSLCRLSGGGGSSLTDAKIIKSKILSLELILSILECPSVRRNTQFIEAVKQALFESLLTNSVSPIGKIFATALDIFALLLKNFDISLLVNETGVFINQVFVYILESENSSFTHKKKVLEILGSAIFSDGKLVVDLFALFDCSLDEPNVVELCLIALKNTVVVGTKQNNNGVEIEISSAVLHCFKNLLSSTLALSASNAPLAAIEAEDSSSDKPEPVESLQPPSSSSSKQRKQLLQQGVDLFKAKPNKGMDFLIEHQFIASRSPEVVAQALCEFQPSLDKTAIGDFLGENKGFNLECFYALVERMHFEGKELDVALRVFLSHFRLPGEAQKIDRIMEKFAEKFSHDNPGRYANADAAYVLSFAVIMLNTDLHSAQIKKKMTMEEFVKLGKGINTEIEIVQAELERLYRNIQAEAISLSEDDELRRKMVQVEKPTDEISLQRKRFELFMKETEQMIQKTKESFSSERTKRFPVSDEGAVSDVVKELVRVAHAPILASFQYFSSLSNLQSEQEEKEFVAALAQFLKLCIALDLDNAMRVECMNLLYELTRKINLSAVGNLFVPIEAIRTLLAIALSDGNGLSSCWAQVVSVMSFLDKVEFVSTQKTSSEIEKSNALSILESLNLDSIDLILSKSSRLSPVNILALTGALVSISTESELPESRLFCAQKLVEVADFNMGRIRLVWSKLWNVISPFFVKISQSLNSNVSMFGIDSLRQLALKFMSKPELGNYHFQSEFMKPFFVIMNSPNSSVQIQELIVSVVESLVKQVSGNLKSGWISVFSCLRVACRADNVALLEHACEILKEIESSTKALHKGENFREFTSCLNALIANKLSTPTTLSFVWASCEAHIALLANPDSGITEDGELTSHWLCMFRCLSVCLSDARNDIRDRAVELLFEEIIEKKIACIDPDTIQIFLRAVLIPWLDDLLHSLGDSLAMEAGTATIQQVSDAFNKVVKINFQSYFHKYMFEILNFNQLLVLFDRSDKVAQLGLSNIRASLIGNVHFEDFQKFDQVIEGLVKLLLGTIPTQLLENTNLTTLSALPFSPERIVAVCMTHLNVIQLIGDLIDALAGESIGESQLGCVVKLMDALSRSRQFACRFNAEIQLREKYKSLGFMRDLKQLPGLLKQERAASTVSLKILFLVELNSKNFDVANEKLAQCRSSLRDVCNELVDNYIAKETKLGTVAVQIRDTLIDEIEREINGLVPLVNTVIIAGFSRMTESEFFHNREWIFDLLCKLVKVNNAAIRASVAAIMQQRIRAVLVEMKN